MPLEEVTTPAPYLVTGGGRFRVVAYDLGIKRTILRQLAGLGTVEVVPASTTAAEVLAREPDGVFLSNGPGDPAQIPYVADAVAGLLGQVPVFGICLGHQVLGRAIGAETVKLPFGHHGGNHPVQHLASGRVEITSQNHNFAVAADSLGDRADVTHVNLNDRVCEGMRLRDFATAEHERRDDHEDRGEGPAGHGTSVWRAVGSNKVSRRHRLPGACDSCSTQPEPRGAERDALGRGECSGRRSSRGKAEATPHLGHGTHPELAYQHLRLQFPPALIACGNVRLDCGNLRTRNRLQCISRQEICLLAIVAFATRAHDSLAPRAWRSLCNPVRMRVFTVPSGCFSFVATSVCVNSEKKAASITALSSSVRLARAACSA